MDIKPERGFVLTGFMLSIAVMAGVAAAFTWLVFLRPAKELRAPGVITAKVFKPAHTVSRPPAGGTQRQDWGQQRFHMPDGYIFSIRLQPGAEIVEFWLEKTAAREFSEGHSVEVIYQKRGLSPLWTRHHVKSMRKLTINP